MFEIFQLKDFYRIIKTNIDRDKYKYAHVIKYYSIRIRYMWFEFVDVKWTEGPIIGELLLKSSPVRQISITGAACDNKITFWPAPPI